jgi:hypothetical protein
MISRISRWLEENEARRLWVLSILSAFLLCARFPRYLLHAELWGDDGCTFYPQAYYYGVRSLSWPVNGYLNNGYLNTVQRLGALLAVYGRVPLLWLPTAFAMMGLSMQLAVCVFLISSRLEPLWKSWRARAAFAAMYIYLPNSLETFGNLTNSQWHMALLAFLIVVSPPAVTPAWRVFDAAILAISSLSGPFTLLMIPFCLVALWKYRNAIRTRIELLTRSLLLCVGAVVQVSYLLHHHSARSGALGATPMLLIRIIAFRVVMGLLLGLHGITRIWFMSWWTASWPVVVVITLAVAPIYIFAFTRAGYLFRAFSIFAAMLFIIELASPVAVGNGMTQWQGLTLPFPGQRYFLVPMLALLGAFFVLAAQRSLLERRTALTAIAVMLCIGVPADSFFTHLKPTDYEAKAKAFDAAPPGTRGTFPQHPTGLCDMVLVKKAD